MKCSVKLLVFLFFISSVFLACEQSFLNGPAQGVLDDETLANQDGVEGVLISAYSLLDGWAGAGGWAGASSNWIFGSVASDDAYKGSEPGDAPSISDIEIYQWATSSTQRFVNDKWGVTYDGIYQANATIKLLNSIEDISEFDQNRIRGEALFLRAHYHFEAWKMWKNIPYYTENDIDFKKTNVGTDAIPLIVNDLTTAIELLPKTQPQIGRSTEWTAKAMKGRVQIYSGDFEGALATLRDVVDNGPYELEKNFHNVFSALHNNGKETVLAYQASVNDGNTNGENGNRNDRLNFPHSGSPFGCCGFHQPSQNLVNAFKVDQNGLPFLDGSWNDSELTEDDPVDPRLDWTVGRDGVPYLDWEIHAPDWIRNREWAGPYSPKKNVYEKSSNAANTAGWASYQLHSMNLHLLRYADVLLLLAEAEIEAGDIENARQLINTIRERAGMGAQGPLDGDLVVDMNDPAISWANYKIGLYPSASWDSEKAIKALKIERRLELAMEGHRFFDLRRWNDAEEVLNAYIDVEKTRIEFLKTASEFNWRHALYPLPYDQIELSKVVNAFGEVEKRLVQNTGW